MPNGNPDFYEKELPALEAFFAPTAGVLKDLADDHNLMLDRYYHQSPSWRFNCSKYSGRFARGILESRRVLDRGQVTGNRLEFDCASRRPILLLLSNPGHGS